VHIESIGWGLQGWYPDYDRPGVCQWRSWLLQCCLSILPGGEHSKLGPFEKLHGHSWVHQHLLFAVDDDFRADVSANSSAGSITNLRSDSNANFRTDTDTSASTHASDVDFRNSVDLRR